MRPLSEYFLVSESEYRANLAGLNTFFGAVLGFVLAGIDRLDTMDFAIVLLLTSGIVVTILYISASRWRLLHAATALAFILVLPAVVAPILDSGVTLPDKLQPTLGVWALMTILVEFYPRLQEEIPRPEESSKPKK